MKTWFITGASRGLGREIARAALASGDQVVATARQADQLATLIEQYQDRALALPLDVTDSASIKAAIGGATQRFGRIDVLVNNAGYGQLGAFETLSEASIERQFATNVFGVFDVTRAVLPVMRTQRSGLIVSITSIAGLVGFGGSSMYCASKFAIEGWSESLNQELAQFGIRTLLIEPGQFRTDFLDGSSVSYGDIAIDDYAAFDAKFRNGLDAASHKQAGDPAKFGQAVLAVINSPMPPVRFAAGSDAWKVVTTRASAHLKEAEAWRDVTLSTDSDD